MRKLTVKPARCIMLRGCEHVTPSLIQLHWLPVCWRIDFKLCTIMHTVHTGRCLAYLQLIHTVSSTTTCPGLHSAVSTDYVVPQPRTKFGERAFSYTGPVALNSLPVHVGEEMDFYRFKRLLKTHTFNLAYNVY